MAELAETEWEVSRKSVQEKIMIVIWGGVGAQLKCVWARNVFGRQRKSLTLDKIIQFLQLVGVTFSGA